MPACFRLLAAFAFGAAAAAATVEVRPPLTSDLVLARDVPAGAVVVSAVVDVPDGAPADLGMVAFAAGDAGWRQRAPRVALTPGRHHLHLSIADAAGEGRQCAGLRFWSALAPVRIEVSSIGVASLPTDDPVARVFDLRIDGLAADGASASSRACAAWSVEARLSARDPRWNLALLRSDGARITVPAVRGADGTRRATVHPPSGAWRVSIVVGSVEVALPPLQVTGDDGMAGARSLRLAGPLDTVVPLPALDDGATVEARLYVPDDAPTDLAAGFQLRGSDGSALPVPPPRALVPGLATLRLERAPAAAQAALVLWSSQASTATLRLLSPRVRPGAPAPTSGRHALLDARLSGGDIELGEPWELSTRPSPRGATVTATATCVPKTISLPVIREGECVALRWHPVDAGSWRVDLDAVWPDHERRLGETPRFTVRDDGGQWSSLTVRAPFGTRLPVGGRGETRFALDVLVGDDAPPDLALAAWISDDHGRWWQSDLGGLAPGLHRVRFDAARQPPHGVDHTGEWSTAQASLATRSGFVLSTARGSASVRVRAAKAPAAVASTAPRLEDLRIVSGGAGLRAGERYEVEVRPQPMPANPDDPEEFALDLVASREDGGSVSLPAFWRQPMCREDEGDGERLSPSGPARFVARFRPREPGAYHLRLVARWAGGAQASYDLPPLRVDGPPWDGFVRVDADHRFFSVGGSWFWPLGPNLRSVWDLRSRDHLGTRVTPGRGTFAYDAYLARLSDAGASAVEVWLSSWNLALEWRGDWAPHHGVGRYSDENAWRLEHILDEAAARGMRVNLVLNNHGQASDWCDAEWENNPWNCAHHGPLMTAGEIFTDPRALAGQERLRRYLIGRYADHPAVMAWKLWSEIDLTSAARTGGLQSWHQQAVARWHALDSYGHPVTTHWCSDYTHVDPAIASLDGLGFVCCDAYHGYGTGNANLLADLLVRTSGSLASYRKPFLVTEFGANWDAGPEPEVLVDHLSGPWAALVCGHGGAPMLWWFEWIDQRRHFEPYRALSRFLAGEDARGGRGVSLGVDDQRVWARAWETHGRVLGYLLDRDWGQTGRRLARGTVDVRYPATIRRGHVRVQWWDAETGVVREERVLDHPGGELVVLRSPALDGHLALKIIPETAP